MTKGHNTCASHHARCVLPEWRSTLRALPARAWCWQGVEGIVSDWVRAMPRPIKGGGDAMALALMEQVGAEGRVIAPGVILWDTPRDVDGHDLARIIWAGVDMEILHGSWRALGEVRKLRAWRKDVWERAAMTITKGGE
jgi:hypothetical protein